MFFHPIFLFFIQSHDEIHAVDSTSDVWVRRSGSSYEAVRYYSDFSVACIVLRCQFRVLSLSFIGFLLKALSNGFELPL